MRMIPLTMAVLVFSGLANADCIGSDSFKTCNDNSGKKMAEAKLADRFVATQKIFHDERYPSRLLLPVQK